jgi:hypothetical protein
MMENRQSLQQLLLVKIFKFFNAQCLVQDKGINELWGLNRITERVNHSQNRKVIKLLGAFSIIVSVSFSLLTISAAKDLVAVQDAATPHAGPFHKLHLL